MLFWFTRGVVGTLLSDSGGNLYFYVTLCLQDELWCPTFKGSSFFGLLIKTFKEHYCIVISLQRPAYVAIRVGSMRNSCHEANRVSQPKESLQHQAKQKPQMPLGARQRGWWNPPVSVALFKEVAAAHSVIQPFIVYLLHTVLSAESTGWDKANLSSSWSFCSVNPAPVAILESRPPAAKSASF